MEDHDVANNEVPDVDALHGSNLAAHNGDVFVLATVSELDKLLVLCPVIPALDKNEYKQSAND